MVKRYCKLDAGCEALLQHAADAAGISMRGYEKILKMARTIADLELREQIMSSISQRRSNIGFWILISRRPHKWKLREK